MLVYAKKVAALSVVTLVALAVLLPIVSFAATSPTVSVLSPLKGGLRAPARIALDAVGNIYVTDQRIRGVIKFNALGVQQQTISTASTPNGLAFAQDGTLLVSQPNLVARYDTATGQEVSRLAGGQLLFPVGIAVDDVTGYIYVADSRANQVEIYTASGNFVKAFAQGVRADAAGATVINPVGKLSMPTGISFEKVSRQVAVVDTLGQRVQFFDVDGTYLKSVGIPIPISTTGSAVTTGPMQFEAPAAIAFEYSKDQPPVLSRMYVVDTFRGNVQVVNPVTAAALNVVGSTTNYIGSVGMLNGQLMSPNDAVFDATNSRLLVVNGLGNVTIYGIDGGKNPIYSDITPPVVTVNPVPAEVTVNTLTISGTVEAGSSVQVVAGNSALVGSVAYAGSSWSVMVNALALGNNSFTVTAKDTAGNSAAAQVVNVNYMLPAPGVTVSSVPVLTNAGELVLSGTVDEGAAVTVANESTLASGTAVVAGASWTHKVTLAEGANSIVITAQKPMSLKSTKTLNIALDSTPPALEVSTLSDGSTTSNPTPNVTGNAPDASAVAILLNNVPVATTFVGGSFSGSLVRLLPGANEVVVEARDVAGNVTVDRRVMYFDATIKIAVVSPMDNSYTNTARLQITGSVDKVSTILVAGQPGVVDTDNNWLADIDLISGLNTIEVTATDLYGNTSSIKRSVTLDTVNPILAITYPVQDIVTNVNSKVITGTVDDYSTVTYTVNDKTNPVPVEAGGFAFKVDFVKEGLYPLIVSASDYAGNTTTAIRNLTYDATSPLLTLDAVKWQAHALGGKITGAVEPGATVVVKGIFVKEGIETSSIAANVVGDKWSADLNGYSFNQTKLSIEAKDTAGNVTVKVISNNSFDKNN